MPNRLPTLLVLFLLDLSGCSDDESAGNPAIGGESGTAGSASLGGSAGQSEGGTAGSASLGGSAGQSEGGTAGSASLGGSAGQGEGGSAGDGGASDPGEEFGFVYREPQENVLSCSGEMGESQYADADWLCTFDDGTVSGYVYVASTPVACAALANPVYETSVAQISIDGNVQSLTNTQLDYGGNHHNDFIDFDYAGKTYTLNHSSFGFGYRVCQNMDCMRIMEGSTLIEDGCTKARSLPVVCVPILPDLTHEPLIDTFAPCPGDPNYE